MINVPHDSRPHDHCCRVVSRGTAEFKMTHGRVREKMEHHCVEDYLTICKAFLCLRCAHWYANPCHAYCYYCSSAIVYCYHVVLLDSLDFTLIGTNLPSCWCHSFCLGTDLDFFFCFVIILERSRAVIVSGFTICPIEMVTSIFYFYF